MSLQFECIQVTQTSMKLQNFCLQSWLLNRQSVLDWGLQRWPKYEFSHLITTAVSVLQYCSIQREYLAAILSTSSLCLRLDSSTLSGRRELETLLACLLSLCLTTVISETPAVCKDKRNSWRVYFRTETWYNWNYNWKTIETIIIIAYYSIMILWLRSIFQDLTRIVDIILFYRKINVRISHFRI